MDIRESSSPVRHWILDGFLSPDRAGQVWDSLPSSDWPHWVRYDNDCEKKRTSNDLDALPYDCQSLNEFVNKFIFPKLAAASGIEGLVPDPLLHGGGLHVTDPGGLLGSHIDYARHPKLPTMERRLNMVTFLNPTWEQKWGGAFVLYADDGSTPVTRIYPAPGRIVAWLPSDDAYHGCEQVTGPVERVTFATYYLAPLRDGVSRKRALFVPARGK